MTLLHRLASILRWLFHRNRAEQEMNEELQAFVDMAAADKVRDGASPADARRMAVLNLGGVEQTKERVRSGRYGAWLDEITRDVRYGLRMCARNPGFSAVIVLTLAVGIGANTAIFSIVDAVLLRPLTYGEPERLVMIHETIPERGRNPVGATEFEEWRRSAQSFERMALVAVTPVILTGAGEPERLDAARVSAAFFPMLGIDPAFGRTFSRDEETVGRHHVVVLSDGLWRRHFGADPSIIGRTLTLNDESYVVSGVLPPRFRFPRLEQIFVMGISGGQPQLWLPFAITDAERGENSFAAMAQLKHGVSATQARAEAAFILKQLAQGIPHAPTNIDVEIVPLRQQIAGASRDVLALVWAAIIGVLMIACVNIANLLLSRSAVRSHELAIRSALGASRWTLFRHAWLDSMTLAVLGGIGGVVLAASLLPVLVRLAPLSVPRLDEVALDPRAVVFAALLTLVTGLVVGLLPARRAARTDVIERLRMAGRTATMSRGGRDVRRVMVAIQIALTVACLAATGLVVESLRNVFRVNPGFSAEGILTIDVSLSPGRYSTRARRAEFVRDVLDRLEAVPGVTSVGFVNRLPFSGTSVNLTLAAEGTEQEIIPFTERPQADIRSVNAEYFRTFGIPLLRGALFRATDTNRAVAVVSAAMANRAWPGEDAVGKRFRLSAQPGRLVEVVGVVGDVRNMGFETSRSTTVYLPYWQGFLNASSFAVRTSGDPAAMASAIRAAISAVDHDVPIDGVTTMQGIVSQSVEARTFEVTLMTLFGVMAIALSGIGVFGVMSHAVTQRAKEFGIRLAVGATPLSLQWMVVGNVLRIAGTGVVIGAPLAVAAGYVMRDMLFGINPQDPRVLIVSSTAIVLVAIIAGWVPARHATQIDPVATLRTE
jgi:putative ABC transport system permease protein